MGYPLYDVVVKTANKKKLIKFYAETLGLGIRHDCPECAVLDLGKGQWLVLIHDKRFAPVKNPKALRTTFGFRVHDVDEVYHQLKAKKVRFTATPEDQDWGARTVSAYDPDGNELEFIQEKSELSEGEESEPRESREPVAA